METDKPIKPITNDDIVLSHRALPVNPPFQWTAILYMANDLYDLDDKPIYVILLLWILYFYVRSTEHHWDLFHIWRNKK